MSKKFVIIISIIISIFLIGILLALKNSPIVSMACVRTSGFGCKIDECGFCATKDSVRPYKWPNGSAMCPVGLGYVDLSGTTCKRVSEKSCVMRKTLRTPVCAALKTANSSIRRLFGIETKLY